MNWISVEKQPAPTDGRLFVGLFRYDVDAKAGDIVDVVMYYENLVIGPCWDAPNGASYDLGCLTHWFRVPPLPNPVTGVQEQITVKLPESVDEARAMHMLAENFLKDRGVLKYD